MDVTIQDAINAFALLSEHVNENGFLHECYNLGISALKTVQDGGYQLNTIPQEILEEIATYDCKCIDCDICKYYYKDHCLYTPAKGLLNQEKYAKEIKEWIQENS